MAAKAHEERAQKTTHPRLLKIILMNSKQEIKTNISLVMQRIETIKREYEQRKFIETTLGISAAAATIFSSISAAYEKYNAAGLMICAGIATGFSYYWTYKNNQLKQEQLSFLETRKSELEIKLEN